MVIVNHLASKVSCLPMSFLKKNGNAILELASFWEGAQPDVFLTRLDKVDFGNNALKWDGFLDAKRFFKALMHDLHKYGELILA